MENQNMTEPQNINTSYVLWTERLCEPNLNKSGNKNTGTLGKNASEKSEFFIEDFEENSTGEDFLGFRIAPKKEKCEVLTFGEFFHRHLSHPNCELFSDNLEPQSVSQHHHDTINQKAQKVPIDEKRKKDEAKMPRLKRSLSMGDVSQPEFLDSPVKKEPEPKNDLNVVSTINISNSPEKDQLNITVLQDSIRKVLQDTIKSDHSIRNINMKIEVITTSVTREEVDKLPNTKDKESENPKIIVNAEHKKEPEDDNVSTISSLVALSSSREGSVAKDLSDSPKSTGSCADHVPSQVLVEELIFEPVTNKKAGASPPELPKSNAVLRKRSVVSESDLFKKNSMQDHTSSNSPSKDINSEQILEDTMSSIPQEIINFDKNVNQETSKLKYLLLESESDSSDNTTLAKKLESIKSLEKTKKKSLSPRRRSLRRQIEAELDGTTSDSNAELPERTPLMFKKFQRKKSASPTKRQNKSTTIEDYKQKRKSLSRSCKDPKIAESERTTLKSSDSDNQEVINEVTITNVLPNTKEKKTAPKVNKLPEEIPIRTLPSRKCKPTDETSVYAEISSSEDKITSSEDSCQQNKVITTLPVIENLKIHVEEETTSPILHDTSSIQGANNKETSEEYAVNSIQLTCEETLKEYGIIKDFDVILSPLAIEQNLTDSDSDSTPNDGSRSPEEIELETKMRLFKCLKLQNVTKDSIDTSLDANVISEKKSDEKTIDNIQTITNENSIPLENICESTEEVAQPNNHIFQFTENTKPARRNSVCDVSNVTTIQEKPLSRSKSLACLKEEYLNLSMDFKDAASSMLDVFAPMRITRSKVPLEHEKSTENMQSVLEGRKSHSIKRAKSVMSNMFEDVEKSNRSIRSKSVPRKQYFNSLAELDQNVARENDEERNKFDEELTEIDRKRKKRETSESPKERKKFHRLTRSRSVGRKVLEKEFGKELTSEDLQHSPKATQKVSRSKNVAPKILHDMFKKDQHSAEPEPPIIERVSRSKSVSRNIKTQPPKSDRFLRSKSVPREVIEKDIEASTGRTRSKSVVRRSLPARNFETDTKQNEDDKLSVSPRRGRQRKNLNRVSVSGDQNVKVDQKMSSGEPIINFDDCTYKIGNFVWAQIGKFPFWPAMVCEDPVLSNFIRTAQPPSHKTPITQYHVRFFNDNGKRAWVADTHLMMYCTKDDITEMADKLKELKIKNLRFLKPRQPRTLQMWCKAIEELETLKQKSSKEVYSHLVKSYVSHYIETHKTRKSLNEKQLTLEEDQSLIDLPKKSDVKNKNQEKVLTEKVGRLPEKRRAKSECRTLSTGKSTSEKKFPPIKIKIKLRKNGLKSEYSSSTDDSFSEDVKGKKAKKEKTRSDIFAKPNKVADNATVETPKVKKIRHSLPAKLERKKEPKRKKEDDFNFVRPSDSDTEAVHSRKKKVKNDENSDAELRTPDDIHSIRKKKRQNENMSDTESKPQVTASKYSFEYQVELHKKYNPFNGLGRTKVCHYCLQPGELHKCKGKCGGVFHVECASKVLLPRPQPKTSRQFKKKRRSGSLSSPLIGTPTRSNKEVSPSDTESSCSSRSSSKVQIVSVRSKGVTNLSNPNVPCLPPTFNQLTLDEQIDYRMKEIAKTKDNKVCNVAKRVMSRFDDQTTYADSSSTDTSSEEGSGIYLASQRINNGDGKTVADKDVSADKPVSIEKTSGDVPSPPRTSQLAKEKIVKHVTADSVIVDERTDLTNFKCEFCKLDKNPPCGACGLEVSPKGVPLLHKCAQLHCNKTFHKPCLKIWPQAQWSIGKWTKDQNSQDMFTCPSHVCHTCFSEELGTGSIRLPGDKLAKCLLCPASYHASTFCLPAGSEVLGGSQLICPRHRKSTQPLNTSWCFICSEGGNLVCCDMCPTSVHPECQPINFIDDDKYICEDCESGRFPLYDEVVWVKLGSYRWWPALVLFPNEVPENMLSLKHQIGDFAVRFFGTNDHYWVSKSRSFLFQEGDRGGGPEESISSKKKVYELFSRAIEDAAIAYQLKRDFKLRREAESITSLKPPPFVKTLKNKPIGNVKQLELDLSNTTACECDPNGSQPCGPESDCINRLLLTECDPDLCPAAARCRNQSFEKREYPPMMPYKTQGRGWGLRNLAFIKKGQFIIEYVGDLINQEEYQRRIKKMHETKEENYYFMTLDNERMIDAGPKGNLSRFMNHSCNPNCETQKWTVKGDTRVGLFALKDIEPGSELTFNYNLECVGQEKKTCKCGAPNCSGFIGAKAKPEHDSDSSKTLIIKPKKLTRKKPELTPLPPCFICSRRGGYISCVNKLCNKKYHLRCLELTEKPDATKYVCPRHNCNLCSNRTIRCCVKCLNSFCPSHSEGNIRHDKILGFVCRLHDGHPSGDSDSLKSTEKTLKIQLKKKKKQEIKSLKELSKEEQRLQRDIWKISKRKSRENRKLNTVSRSLINTVISSPSTSEDDSSSKRRRSEKLRARKRQRDSSSNMPTAKKPNLEISSSDILDSSLNTSVNDNTMTGEENVVSKEVPRAKELNDNGNKKEINNDGSMEVDLKEESGKKTKKRRSRRSLNAKKDTIEENPHGIETNINNMEENLNKNIRNPSLRRNRTQTNINKKLFLKDTTLHLQDTEKCSLIHNQEANNTINDTEETAKLPEVNTNENAKNLSVEKDLNVSNDNVQRKKDKTNEESIQETKNCSLLSQDSNNIKDNKEQTVKSAEVSSNKHTKKRTLRSSLNISKEKVHETVSYVGSSKGLEIGAILQAGKFTDSPERSKSKRIRGINNNLNTSNIQEKKQEVHTETKKENTIRLNEKEDETCTKMVKEAENEVESISQEMSTGNNDLCNDQNTKNYEKDNNCPNEIRSEVNKMGKEKPINTLENNLVKDKSQGVGNSETNTATNDENIPISSSDQS